MWGHLNKGTKRIRVLCIMLIISIIFGFKYNYNMTTQAAEEFQTKPSFTIENVKFSPEKPKVGEDITVTGTIKPNDFKMDVPENDIVLVLDVSGSMKDNIYVNCMNNYIESNCTETRGNYCTTCDEYVEEKHSESKPYADHQVVYEWYQYYCLDCRKTINIDQYSHRNEQPYKNHSIVEDYCKTHRVQGEHNKKIVSNSSYCSEHRRYGEHGYYTSKIDELKKAANNFIAKMKDVPNLKIGIVAYSSQATNTTISNNYDDGLYSSSNTKALKDKINSLKADGGTNSGEGIRKALYMLNKSKSNGKKSVVFMSDGEPTFYSYNRFNDYYTQIDNSNPYWGGEGSSDSKLESLRYAMTIGNMVKNNSINAFTIGYGLDDSGNEKMKAIQGSMLGRLKPDDITQGYYNKVIQTVNPQDSEVLSNINEDDGFFSTSDGAIDNVFNTIADKIIKEYNINDGIFTDTMIDGFNLGVGSETVSIPNMMYKTDGIVINGKLTFKCEPYDFSFIIKANKPGVFEDLFNHSKITFPWNGQTIECEMPVKSLEIEDNILPIIDAKPENREITGVNQGEDAEVVYDINPKDFELNSSDDGSGLKDIVFLIDMSSSMAGNNKLVPLLNSIDNKIVSRFTDNTSNTNDNVQISFVTYNSNTNIVSRDSNGSPFLKTQGDLHNKIIDLGKTQVNSIKDSKRDVGKAIEMADQILNSDYAQSDASKNIVIISSDEVDDYSSTDIESIKNKGYNLISVELRKERNEEIGSFKRFHTELGGELDSYISSNPDGGNYNDLEDVMRRVAERIVSSRKIIYEFNDVQLNFNVGSKLTPLSEVVVDNNGDQKTMTASIVGKNLNIDLPKIKYRYNNQTNKYQSDSFKVKFKVKIDGEGKIEFDKNDNNIKNYIQYEKINKTRPKIGIDTPIIIVEKNIFHGIYDKDTIGYIDESKEKSFPIGAIVPMAGYFEVLDDSHQKIQVQLMDGLESCGSVQIIDAESLKVVFNDDNGFNDTIYEKNIYQKGKYFILYSVKIKSPNNTKTILKKYFTDDNYQTKEYEIQISQDAKLPDLF